MPPFPPPETATEGPGGDTRPAGRLEGKIALITGGGSGIGRAMSLLFAREGAKVVVAGRRSEPLQAVVKEIRAFGGMATLSKGDISKSDRVELMVQGATFTFGGLDILVNNAGIFLPGSVTEITERRWDKVIETNLKGTFLVSRHAIAAMKDRGGGSIINNASIHGLVGARNASAYCASKGGLVQLTRAMALDHAADGIRVNAICPEVIDSPFTREPDGKPGPLLEAAQKRPTARTATPEDIARLALFLASDESSWMTGATVSLDGSGVGT